MLRLARPRARLAEASKCVYTTQRYRSGGHVKTKARVPPAHGHGHGGHAPAHGRGGHPQAHGRGGHVHTPYWPPHAKNAPHPPKPPTPLVSSPSEITPYFEANVSRWASDPRTLARLSSFYIPPSEAETLLQRFVEAVEKGELTRTKGMCEFYQLGRVLDAHEKDAPGLEVIYTSSFFWWCARPEVQDTLQSETNVPSSTLTYIHSLVRASDRTFPADEYPLARRIHRKVIMHVGPTNSGKTHHALRALAAARSGVYAGPLRLLAHEVWERLNTGQITPLGIEPSSPPTPTPTTDASTPNPPALSGSRLGNPHHARLCSMITGEEQKLMGPAATLMSCTIEMLSHFKYTDVAVIDEIQMIADRERGNAWVGAVLGVNSPEVHLCGEETAVPIVKALLRHTGDEVEVRRYERLTPLVVEETSLEGDFGRVRKGDCIVTFSRSSIFKVKREVEAKTGMRCAVVYGRLPPEVRSEQAALFNDPDSGYDVLVGSDAIGMGLNLKIKRIIFESVSKWNGPLVGDTPLPISSVKQIAGRAGRFGLHSRSSTPSTSLSSLSSPSSLSTSPSDPSSTPTSSPGGTVTSLHPSSLPYISHCLAAPFQPLTHAYLSFTPASLARLAAVLPPGAKLQTMLEVPRWVGRVGRGVRVGDAGGGDAGVGGAGVGPTSDADKSSAMRFIETHWSSMDTASQAMLVHAPVPWRDRETARVIEGMLVRHARVGRVRFAGDGWDGRDAGDAGRGAKDGGKDGKKERYEGVMKERVWDGKASMGYGECLEAIERLMASSLSSSSPSSSSTKPKKSNPPTPKHLSKTALLALPTLESLHKTLVFYLWMAYRHPVVYAEYEEAGACKARVEGALNWCLGVLGEGGRSATGGGRAARGKTDAGKDEGARVGEKRAGRATDGLVYKTRMEVMRAGGGWGVSRTHPPSRQTRMESKARVASA